MDYHPHGCPAFDLVRALCALGTDGDVEVFFPTARGDRQVFTFAAAALERVLEVSVSKYVHRFPVQVLVFLFLTPKLCTDILSVI